VNDLTRPTPPNGTSDVTPWSLSRSEARSLERARNAQAAEGAVRATRVQAAGVVAATGLHMSAMLSREAQFQADGDPAAAARLNFIVDSFAEYAANEVRRFTL
jgi:hypothetical protein